MTGLVAVVAPPLPPERMTARARAYLAIGSARNLLLGALSLISGLVPPLSSYRSIVELGLPVPVGVWGALFLVLGGMCAYAGWSGKEGPARTALVLSAMAAATWAALFGASNKGYVLAICLAAIAAKDFVVCAQPMRSPFEPLVRRYLPNRRAEPPAPADDPTDGDGVNRAPALTKEIDTERR